jgi:hypothetical protein
LLCKGQRTIARFVGGGKDLFAALRDHLDVILKRCSLTLALLAAIAIATWTSGCGQATVTPAPQPSGSPAMTSSPTVTVVPTAGSSLRSVAPSASTGFAFDPESIVGYFQQLGYACSHRQPSSQAAGHAFESCQLVDADGRTRTLGIVSDPNDDLADAFFSIRGGEGEAVLDPAPVLEPFGAFLGAVLGEAGGTEALPWVAGHLGDAYSTTTIGELTLATYTDAPDDHSALTVEIANQAYLEAPRPSSSPPR